MPDTIEPNEFILKRGESITVEVTIVMTSERLEILIEKDSNSKVIHINKLSLIYGDEVSRVRVSKLVSSIKVHNFIKQIINFVNNIVKNCFSIVLQLFID